MSAAESGAAACGGRRRTAVRTRGGPNRARRNVSLVAPRAPVHLALSPALAAPPTPPRICFGAVTPSPPVQWAISTDKNGAHPGNQIIPRCRAVPVCAAGSACVTVSDTGVHNGQRSPACEPLRSCTVWSTITGVETGVGSVLGGPEISESTGDVCFYERHESDDA